jgi:hypothetical protein
MTRAEALQRADQCDRLAAAAADPDDALALRAMRQMWLNLAATADEPGVIDKEFDRLVDLESGFPRGLIN